MLLKIMLFNFKWFDDFSVVRKKKDQEKLQKKYLFKRVYKIIYF
jgi:hypothetical protein